MFFLIVFLGSFFMAQRDSTDSLSCPARENLPLSESLPVKAGLASSQPKPFSIGGIGNQLAKGAADDITLLLSIGYAVI
jgi:hypothetical protein